MKMRLFAAVVLCAALCLAATPAFADGLDFSSSGLLGGSVEYAGTGGAAVGAGIPITTVSFGSSSDAVFGKTCGLHNVACGTLFFTTGNFLSAGVNGFNQKFETFAGGGTITLIGEVPGDHHLVTLLSANFAGPVTFTLINSSTMQMSGTINVLSIDPSVKALFPGAPIGSSGSISLQVPVTLFKNGGFNGHAENTNIFIATPEPSSLALLGSGFFGLASLIRRKRGNS